MAVAGARAGARAELLMLLLLVDSLETEELLEMEPFFRAVFIRFINLEPPSCLSSLGRAGWLDILI